METGAAYQHALKLLHRVSTEQGFVAAAQQEDNYCRVWTRDAVVCGLAALLTEDARLINTFKRSLTTIWDHQHTTGFLPSNVDITTNNTSYGGTVGRADTPGWAIIGLCRYAIHTGEIDWAKNYKHKVIIAFQLMDAWEFNGKQLMYVPQGADWADEYLQHGYILFDQLLRIWALELAGKVFAQNEFLEKAKQIKTVIRQNFFYNTGTTNWYSSNLVHQKETAPKAYWWMGFNPAQIYPQFDLQANALSLLLHIGDQEQTLLLFNHIEAMVKANNNMLPSFSPAITDTDCAMHELKDNFAFRFRNKPYEFHNGGLWPVWNGWMIAALEANDNTALANILKKNMLETISKDNFNLNECYHGQTVMPCGVVACAWSAAGIIMAEKGSLLFNLSN